MDFESRLIRAGNSPGSKEFKEMKGKLWGRFPDCEIEAWASQSESVDKIANWEEYLKTQWH